MRRYGQGERPGTVPLFGCRGLSNVQRALEKDLEVLLFIDQCRSASIYGAGAGAGDDFGLFSSGQLDFDRRLGGDDMFPTEDMAADGVPGSKSVSVALKANTELRPGLCGGLRHVQFSGGVGGRGEGNMLAAS